jgi:hypothetical protein
MRIGSAAHGLAGRMLSVPPAIDTTGSTDVTSALNTWLQTVAPQPGDTVQLAGTYLLSDSCLFGGDAPITGVTYDLRQATLKLPTTVASQWGRPVLCCLNLHNCTVLGGQILGANTYGADAVGAGLEGWHGILVGHGSTNVTLTGAMIRNTWGDFIAIGGHDNQQITFDQVDAQTTGRHAISVRHVSGLSVTNSRFSAIRHLFFDHEPVSGEGLDGLNIGGCTSTAGGLGIFLQLRPAPSTSCSNINVHDHTLTNGHYRVDAPAGGVQRNGFQLARLNNTPATAARTMPLITVGGTDAGWNNLVVNAVHDRVTSTYAAVRATNCPGAEIDLSGFTN